MVAVGALSLRYTAWSTEQCMDFASTPCLSVCVGVPVEEIQPLGLYANDRVNQQAARPRILAGRHVAPGASSA